MFCPGAIKTLKTATDGTSATPAISDSRLVTILRLEEKPQRRECVQRAILRAMVTLTGGTQHAYGDPKGKGSGGDFPGVLLVFLPSARIPISRKQLEARGPGNQVMQSMMVSYPRHHPERQGAGWVEGRHLTCTP